MIFDEKGTEPLPPQPAISSEQVVDPAGPKEPGSLPQQAPTAVTETDPVAVPSLPSDTQPAEHGKNLPEQATEPGITATEAEIISTPCSMPAVGGLEGIEESVTTGLLAQPIASTTIQPDEQTGTSIAAPSEQAALPKSLAQPGQVAQEPPDLVVPTEPEILPGQISR